MLVSEIECIDGKVEIFCVQKCLELAVIEANGDAYAASACWQTSLGRLLMPGPWQIFQAKGCAGRLLNRRPLRAP
jgi:hypothetical protein